MTTATETEKTARGSAIDPGAGMLFVPDEGPKFGLAAQDNPWIKVLAEMELGSAQAFAVELPADHEDVKATLAALRRASAEIGVTVRWQVKEGTGPSGGPATQIIFRTQERIKRPRKAQASGE